MGDKRGTGRRDLALGRQVWSGQVCASILVCFKDLGNQTM
jgi:hypothetical protein